MSGSKKKKLFSSKKKFFCFLSETISVSSSFTECCFVSLSMLKNQRGKTLLIWSIVMKVLEEFGGQLPFLTP